MFYISNDASGTLEIFLLQFPIVTSLPYHKELNINHYNSAKLMKVLLLVFGPFVLFGGKISGFKLFSGWLLLSLRYFGTANLESGSEQPVNQ